MSPTAPSPESLRRYLLGTADPAESAEVEAYLADRPAPATALAELTADDPFVVSLRTGAARVGDEAELQPLIDRLRAVPADPAALTGPAHPGSGEEGTADWVLAKPQDADELGRLGKYRVLGILGQGGMGTLFQGEDPTLGRQVALKTMRKELAAHPAARERFFREARAAARLEHDHIIPIFEVGEDAGVPFIAMPLLKGEPLDARLRRERPLPVTEAVRIARETAEGLAAAHEAGMIHRDIKPGNIWLEAPRERVKILDFGLARRAQDGNNLTRSGAVIGTPAYMAPEQARGQAVDPRADLFALGCMLYEMTTGRRPFTGPDTLAILTSLAVDTPPAPRAVNRSVPAVLSDFIMQLLTKDPARRPGSARAVADTLADIGFRVAPTVVPLTGDVPPNPWAAIDERNAPPPYRPTGRPLRSGLVPGVVVAAGLLLVLIVYLTVIRVETPTGILVIETSDPNVEVVVRKDGAVIKDRVKDREIELKVGQYTIELAEARNGLKLSTDRFAITRNGRETVRVRLEKVVVANPKGKARTDPLPAGNEGFVSLFNGQDLAGWEAWDGTAAGWEVADGMLVGRNSPQMLYSLVGDLRDFHLRVEWKVSPDAVLHLNARSHFTPYQPQGGYTWILGNAPAAPNRTGSISQLGPAGQVARRTHGPDEWVTTELVARGPRMESFVNGQKVAESSDLRWPVGHLALRMATPGGRATIRRLEVKRLPSPEPLRARITDRFVSLFDGKTTSGWKSFEGQTDGLTVEDGCLVSRGRHRLMYSPLGDYRDFHLRVEAWVGKGTHSAISIRSPHQSEEDGPNAFSLDLVADRAGYPARTGGVVAIAPYPRTTHNPEEWVTLEAIFRGGRITILVNGTVTTDVIDRRFQEGHFVLVHHPAGLLRIRRIEVKEFDTPEDATRRLVSFVRNNGGAVWLPGGVVAPPADELPPGAALEKINLSRRPWDRRLNDEDLNILHEVTALEGIQLVGQDVSDLGAARLADFAGLKRLKLLHLDRCPRLTGAAIRLLAAFPMLESLSLEGIRATDHDLRWAAELPALRDLNLTSTPVTDAGLAHLVGLKRLTALRLGRTKVTADGVAALAKELPGCRIEWEGGNVGPTK